MIGIALGDCFPHWELGLALFGAAALAALVSRRSLLVYAATAACFFSAHALRITTSPAQQLARELGDGKHALVVRGVVVSDPKVSLRGTTSFLLRASSIERDGLRTPADVTFFTRWAGSLRYGDEVQLFGVAEPVEGPRNPGEFDFRRYLARRGVQTALVSRYRENGHVLGHPGVNLILQAAHFSRSYLEAVLSRGLEQSVEQRALLCGIVLGERDETPDEVEEQFQQTGTIHLFAVAGLHVGMVAYLLWTVASMLRVPRKAAILLIVPSLFFYAAITGLNTASVRAALMAAIVLGGAFLERRVFPLNSLAAAAVFILLYDTQQLFSMGFQLSFAVVAAIILLADRVFTWLNKFFQPDPFLPRSLWSLAQRARTTTWRNVARGASVSFAAWLGSVPLILPYFYLITPVSLLANVVVVPIAFFVMAVGLLSLVSAAVSPWLSLLFNNANWTLASAILAAVAAFARLPAGHFYLGQPRLPARAQVEITALDLRAGAALHLRDGRRDWMIDCGSRVAFPRTIRSYLRSQGVNRLDGLVLTHGDSAHIGAGPALLRVFAPRVVMDNGAPDRSPTHQEIIAALSQTELPRRTPVAPETFALGPHVEARLLFPPPSFKGRTADDQAFVIQLVISKKWRVLLMSDSGETTERFLLQNHADLQSDVLIKGQHVSQSSGSPAFLDAVKPEFIMTSSTDFPQAQCVRDDWAAIVAARGIRLFRQDQTGAVTLRFFRQSYEAVPFLDPAQTFRSNSR